VKEVIDTNVLVSGLLKPYSHPGAVIRQLAGGQIQLIYDARIIAEYREVLYRPLFGFKHADVEALLVHVKDTGLAVVTAPLPFRLPDPDDEL
jgi:predicted nucleic acid-binding protein